MSLHEPEPQPRQALRARDRQQPHPGLTNPDLLTSGPDRRARGRRRPCKEPKSATPPDPAGAGIHPQGAWRDDRCHAMQGSRGNRRSHFATPCERGKFDALADLALLALVGQGACIKTPDLSRGLVGEGFHLELPHTRELYQYGPCYRPRCSRANMGEVLLASPNLTGSSGIGLNLAKLVLDEAGGLVDGCGVRLFGEGGELLSLTLIITEGNHDLRGVIAVRHD